MGRHAATADVFQAISDPTRRAILDLLAGGERPVNGLAGSFGVTLSAVSQHLRILRDVGLVAERRAGRERWYRVKPAPLREVADWIGHYERFWHGKLDALDQHLRRRK